MVTALAWSLTASLETVISAADGLIRVPSSLTCSPLTNTQPRSIHKSASRREHRPRPDITLERRTPSGVGPGGLAATAGAFDGCAAPAFFQGLSRVDSLRALAPDDGRSALLADFSAAASFSAMVARFDTAPPRIGLR